MPIDPSNPELWGKVVSAAVVPVVMISACGLLCLALYNRLTAVFTRLRALSHEALEDQDALVKGPRTETQRWPRERAKVRAEARQRQADELLAKARLLRRAVAFLLASIGFLLLCSLAVGAGVLVPAALYAAAALFVAGIACALAAVGFALAELRSALDSVLMEHALVHRLGRELGEDGPPTLP
ncbi:MAG: DUF2721 domain-containing protein [Planctomycetia bacterium]|nr:DUF2721 domain-containing protein [Planctomycetia bacterium]